MKANVGTVDKIIRLVLALALFSLYFILPGEQKWFGLAGFIPLLTGLVSWCPLYTLFGINTCSR
ncbi:YgaP family membrane protein [Noviherbaspirillum denitrificans]|uniref:Inner membrane protein YgaP-like transmembrane domain-containing protein n=1 Tax=Noviherbaspirillum denitrificans TaxID=1968433 RepID=A0A254TF91_9BURK|nr:DUF2892 domain-containing protein [Noviherbaspirillum denitrificans]OWW21284.1 hypothetical protein AYR66_19200 [Noviherbaspirillum denitrificans]